MTCLIKTIQPPFSYLQADIFGPIFAYIYSVPMKHWVLVNLCLTSIAVHMKMLHSYNAMSITRGFRRTFALRGLPCIIWIEAGLNIVKSGKDLVQPEVKIVSELSIKFASIEFRATLPKHHEGIEAVSSRTLPATPSLAPISSRWTTKNSTPGWTWLRRKWTINP